MKVFISWSGARSKLLAEALRDWIHDVVQSVECFCSTDDIRAGQRWNDEVNSWLSDTDFGVLCVTPENMTSPWLNFEAGALAKRINNDARVVPVTFGFAPGALDEPLKQFNGVAADEAGIRKLMCSIAEISSPPVDVNRAFERWWPDLSDKIAQIPETADGVATPEPPDTADMFAEILASIRGLGRHLESTGGHYPRLASRYEYEALARVLATDNLLREAVINGTPNAINHVRAIARASTHRFLDDREGEALPLDAASEVIMHRDSARQDGN